jgi:hypothetical protein
MLASFIQCEESIGSGDSVISNRTSEGARSHPMAGAQEVWILYSEPAFRGSTIRAGEKQ